MVADPIRRAGPSYDPGGGPPQARRPKNRPPPITLIGLLMAGGNAPIPRRFDPKTGNTPIHRRAHEVRTNVACVRFFSRSPIPTRPLDDIKISQGTYEKVGAVMDAARLISRTATCSATLGQILHLPASVSLHPAYDQPQNGPAAPTFLARGSPHGALGPVNPAHCPAFIDASDKAYERENGDPKEACEAR